MSRTIDTLHKVAKPKDKIYASLQEEIAKTYLKTAPEARSREKRAWPMSEHRRQWLIAIAAVLLVFIAVFIKNNIDIRVRILTKIPRAGVGQEADKVYADRGISFIDGAVLNQDAVKSAYFLGDAGNFSETTGDEIILRNSKGHGWANYTLEFKEPLDLRKFDVKYLAKGTRGDEQLALVVIDSDKRTYRMERSASSALARDWQRYAIDFGFLGNAVNLKDVSAIRFEFGTLTAGNSSTAVIFLKDIYAAKKKGIKWL